MDECAALNPCKNGGRCQNTRGGYSCSCPQRFAGKNCDQSMFRIDCTKPIFVNLFVSVLIGTFLFSCRGFIFTILTLPSPEKTADISQRHHRCPRETTSEEQAQKSHADDVLSSRSSAFEGLKWVSLAVRPLRSTTKICEVTGHHYGISTLAPQT